VAPVLRPFLTPDKHTEKDQYITIDTILNNHVFLVRFFLTPFDAGPDFRFPFGDFVRTEPSAESKG